MKLYHKQKAIYVPKKGDSVTIIGAGGIGSHTAVCLAKLGVPEIIIYDHDKVERGNYAAQLYPERESEYKVNCVGNAIAFLSYGTTLVPVASEFSGQRVRSTILISGVDNMEARRKIWAAYQKSDVPYFIDARIGGELIYDYCPTTLEQEKRYESSLSGDGKEFLGGPCGATAISYVGFAVAALISKVVALLLMGQGPRYSYTLDLKNFITKRGD